jgi:hypothetical protein
LCCRTTNWNMAVFNTSVRSYECASRFDAERLAMSEISSRFAKAANKMLRFGATLPKVCALASEEGRQAGYYQT